MAKEKEPAVVLIKDVTLFHEDLTKLHEKHAIYIEKGFIIDLDKI